MCYGPAKCLKTNMLNMCHSKTEITCLSWRISSIKKTDIKLSQKWDFKWVLTIPSGYCSISRHAEYYKAKNPKCKSNTPFKHVLNMMVALISTWSVVQALLIKSCIPSAAIKFEEQCCLHWSSLANDANSNFFVCLTALQLSLSLSLLFAFHADACPSILALFVSVFAIPDLCPYKTHAFINLEAKTSM